MLVLSTSKRDNGNQPVKRKRALEASNPPGIGVFKMRIKLKCHRCNEVIECDETVFGQELVCGDCGCPITYQTCPQLVAAKARYDARRKAIKEQQRALARERKMELKTQRAAERYDQEKRKEADDCKGKVSPQVAACPHGGAPMVPSQKPANTGCLGKTIALVVVFFIFVIVCTGIPSSEDGASNSRSSAKHKTSSKRDSASQGAVPQYTVVSSEDVNYATIVRKSYRVRVPRELTKAELTAISKKIVREATSRQTINAIIIFFFLPDSDTSGAFTAGRATWAPGGDWAKANTNLSPRLVVETGGAMGTISKDDVVDLPVAQKKQIFMQLVRYQDGGMDDSKAYTAVAKQFGITVEQAKRIGLEGVVRGWPMP